MTQDDKEVEVHLAICDYIKAKYPYTIFTSESSGIRVFWKQAKMMKRMRSSAGLPDIMIFEPRKSYYGLFLEVKRENFAVYKKDGGIVSNQHIQEQEQMLYRLKQRGYMAEFVRGFDDAKAIIDYYLGN
jgi:hypothetical protein